MNLPFIFFGIDSATWDLILPWVKEGKLPGFSQLLNESMNFYMESTFPPYTACAWPTMFTGMPPTYHKLYDFRKLNSQKQIDISTTNHLHKDYVWSKLSDSNKRVCVYNIPMTFPAFRVNGILISSFDAPNINSNFIYPQNLKQKFLSSFPEYRFSAHGKFDQYNHSKSKVYLKEVMISLEEKIAVARWLEQLEAWDALFINVLEVDHLQHFFWSAMNTNQHEFEHAIYQGYKIVDAYIAHLLKRYSKTHVIMIGSDHGAGEATQTIYLNYWLEQKGWLHFKKTRLTQLKRAMRSSLLDVERLTFIASKFKFGSVVSKLNQNNHNKVVRRVFLDSSDVDWDKTQAYSFGEYGGIFLTKNNKSQRFIQDIMHQLRYDFGKSITHIFDSRTHYKVKYLPTSIPDIQVLFDQGAITSTSVYGFAGHQLFGPTISGKTGSHRMQGILSISLPHKRFNRNKISQCSIYDVTPTIEYICNLPRSSESKGKNLLEKKIDPVLHSLHI
jgi:predicted AlkP superfamily phosphohydrolase/phosphomutase